MRVFGPAHSRAARRAPGDQLHAALESLEIFGVSFICYDASGRRRYASRSAIELLENVPGSDPIARVDRIVCQQLTSSTRRLHLGRVVLAQELALEPCPATAAMYLARPALDDAAAIVVLRPKWPVRTGNMHLQALSNREQNVAQLISAGLSTKEIACRLGISAHTARHHTEHVFSKLGVRTRAAVAALCAES